MIMSGSIAASVWHERRAGRVPIEERESIGLGS
jgi:hypothetical protein